MYISRDPYGWGYLHRALGSRNRNIIVTGVQDEGPIRPEGEDFVSLAIAKDKAA
jgi:hypothetical protein